MNSAEILLLEAMKNMLDDKAKLGLAIHKVKETSHTAQFSHQNIENKFKIKLNQPNIIMFESISAAFHHTHSYQNIDNPQFELSFRKQMDGMSVPQNEQNLAIKYLDQLRNELKMPVGGRIDRLEHVEFTNSAEASEGLVDLSKMRSNEN